MPIRPCRFALPAAALLYAGVLLPSAVSQAAPPDASASSPPARAGIRQVWRCPLALKSIVSIDAYFLLEGRVYAVSNDGTIRAILAHDGEHAWTRRIGGEGDVIQAPQPYHHQAERGAAFTRVDDVVILSLDTGTEIARLKLASAAGAAVVVHDGIAFACEASHRLVRYHISDGLIEWQVTTAYPMQLAPIYIPSDDTLLFSDRSGMVAGARGRDRSRIFVTQLGDRPIGWLAADGPAVYAASADENLQALDRTSGDLLWNHRLPRRPASGPMVTGRFVYVNILGGGVHALDLDRPDHDWFQPEADAFLAEWNGRAVLLGGDGRLLIVSLEDGGILHRVEAGPVTMGVPNVVNAAVIVGNDRGEVRCFMPVGADRLALDAFMPAPIPSTTRPAPDAASGPDADAGTGGAAPAEAAEPADAAAAGTPPPPGRFEDDLLKDPLRSRR